MTIHIGLEDAQHVIDDARLVVFDRLPLYVAALGQSRVHAEFMAG